jgi:putative ABC transport system permease protein
MIISILAGFYPALFRSRFSPKQVLKSTSAGSGSQGILRKALVVTQFSLSTILIIGTIVLYQQLTFIRNKSLGFKPEQLVAILTTGAENNNQVNSLKIELENIPGILNSARTQAYPGTTASGRSLKRSSDSPSSLSVQTVRAGAEIIDVLGVNLLAGKTLPLEKSPGDTTIQIVLNETAINYLGFTPEEAIGQLLPNLWRYPTEIVGVVEDFHFGSLHEEIGAYCYHNATTEGYNFLLVKMATNDIPSTLATIEQTFRKIIPTDFQFSFVDQRLETLYYQDKQLASIVLIFSSLAIFIACLGLYALAAFMTEQRTKEIGIRKALGASVTQVTQMLSRDFIKLVLISFFIAVPGGYYILSMWLEKFAYHIDLSILVFVLAGIISIVIAILTISFESIKAARANPVDSLKGE